MNPFIRFPILLLFLGCALPQSSVAAPGKAELPDPASLPAPKSVTVPRITSTIIIDGNLDEPAWSKAARLGPFSKNDGSGPERERTELRLAYDDKALYL